MKRLALLTLVVIFGSALFTGCISLHTWPDYERSAENKIKVIQESIGGGLKSGALSPDQAQAFLTDLKVIQTDYEELKNKKVSKENWDSVNTRLDGLDDEINRALDRTSGIEDPRSGDRILILQRTLDDARISGRLPATEEREFQIRLDSIRSEYLRMSEDVRVSSYEERADISRKLDSLEMDLNRYR